VPPLNLVVRRLVECFREIRYKELGGLFILEQAFAGAGPLTVSSAPLMPH
jgi:hypothetical protein